MKKIFIMIIIFLAGIVSSESAAAQQNTDNMQDVKEEISVSYSRFEDTSVPIYMFSKKNKGERIAIKIQETGKLFIDAPAAYHLYDSNNRELPLRYGLMEWVSRTEFAGEVKKGETYYIVVPEKVPENYPEIPDNFFIQCYLYKNNEKEIKPDTSLVQWGGRNTYKYFSCKKATWIKFHIEPVFDGDGNVWFVVQKKKGNKWETITENQFAESDVHAYSNFEYGLVKGDYRIRVKCPKEQMYYLRSHVESMKQQKNTTRKKAVTLTKEYRQSILFNDKNKYHWYKIRKRNGNKKIWIQTTGTTGSVDVKIYKKDEKQETSTSKMYLRRGKRGIKRASYITKKIALPKESGTYYVCIAKRSKKTTGEYAIKIR